MRRLIVENCVSLLVIATLVLVYFLAPTPDVLHGTHGQFIVRAVIHPFFHANIFHLLSCCLGVWMLFGSYFGVGWTARHLAVAYALAVVSYAAAIHPAIGFSNVLCACMGLNAPPMNRRYRWWWTNWRVLLTFACMLLLAVFPSISATTHIAAFALGFGFTSIRRLLKLRAI